MNREKLANQVAKFVKESKNVELRNEVLQKWNYLNNEFTKELAFAARDYELGLVPLNETYNIYRKSYNIEKRLREILGVSPLPEIIESII